ncbi:hypothetical protein [Nocardioides nitrophenolicus]|uniref:hypothetical protein n=1 Tax=Nocardioides nitrophenolicus TaxID=60489 RepID=UPI001959FDFE|nr:hypothetical protein [Nocardioides nitrophenolicus]MBM7517887.1 hypothetical protein [Nocardioides nitrophenolicus]
MHSRHLTLGSLALVAVLGSGSGLLPVAAATPAGPDTVPGCGQPAVPAQWGSVEHPAVTRQVAATTRVEWRWQRTVATTEREYARETAAAVVLVHWTRTVEQVEHEYARTVVDRAAVPGVPEQGHAETRVVTPAVTAEEWEYVQQTTGNLRWRWAGWNAGDNGAGWSWTGRTREVEVSPAVTEQVWVVDHPAVPAEPEQSHVETAWVADGTPPPAGATPTGVARTVSSGAEEQDLPVGEPPAGAGWVEGATAEISAAEEERVWLPDGTAPDPGFDATGETRPGPARVETTDVTSALPPAGEGWAELPGSAVERVVEAAREVVVQPAWVEDFVVVAAQPAGPPCAEVPAGVPAGVLAETETQPVIESVVVTGGVVGGEVGGVADGAVVPAVAPASAALPASGA